MELLIFWASFIGAWLLVAGSIYQAALELKDQDIKWDEFRQISKDVTLIPEVSRWWWLVPPVKFILEKHRSDQYRRVHFNTITKEDTELLLSFFNKAQAWAFVGIGGLLIALKETYELMHVYENRNVALFVTTVVVLLFGAILNTVLRLSRSEKILMKKIR